MPLVLGALLLAVAVLLLALAVGGSRESHGVARSLELVQASSATPEVVAAEVESSFGERVLDPLRGRLLGLGRRVAGRDAPERVRHKLDLAGNPVGWTVDSLGWQGTSGGQTADKVAGRVLGAAQPGMIVLMHLGANPDDRTTLDADALPAIIQGLRAKGYSFTTLDALVS